MTDVALAPDLPRCYLVSLNTVEMYIRAFCILLPAARVTCESLSEDKISDNPRFSREPGLAARLAGGRGSGGGQRQRETEC